VGGGEARALLVVVVALLSACLSLSNIIILHVSEKKRETIEKLIKKL
jgi:hypothetical protein